MTSTTYLPDPWDFPDVRDRLVWVRLADVLDELDRQLEEMENHVQEDD